MTPRVVDARYLEGYTLYIRFSDGSEGEVDFEHELTGEIFEPLKEPAFFRQFTVNHEIHTIVWLNGADFSREFLYENLRVIA